MKNLNQHSLVHQRKFAKNKRLTSKEWKVSIDLNLIFFMFHNHNHTHDHEHDFFCRN